MSKKLKIVFMIIVGLILVVIGIAASLLLIMRSQPSQPSLAAADELDPITTSVVVVTRDLFLGDRIAGTDVEIVQVPAEMAPRTIIANIDEAVGKMIKSDLVQGQMVLSNNLADPTNNNQDLSFILSDDHVLMAFPADDLLSRESMVQRGDIVDIFATFKQEIEIAGEAVATDEEPEDPVTRTFTVGTLQNVDVTALILEVIEQDMDASFLQNDTSEAPVKSPARIRAYLLALNPQDALVLKHLKDTGAIFDFVLRSPTSTDPFNLTPVTEEYIIELYGLDILP